jgi:hypothetical protein
LTTTQERDAAADALTSEEIIRCFGVLSHDLKSPIFAIDGFSELLLSDYADKLDADGQDFLRRVRAATQQVKRVLDDMSSTVKLLSRPNALRDVDLRDIVEELRLKFARQIEEGGVTIEVTEPLPSLRCDPDKIREALGAVLSNALFYNDREKGARQVRIAINRAADGMARMCVSDNGIGIDPKYVQQIFDLGVKLDRSRGGGPGYGLYMARRVAESHGGKLTVQSAPGEGSTFCIEFPA